MKRLGIAVGFVLLLACSAAAQDTSRFQVAGGFQYDRFYAEPGKGVNCWGGNGQFDWFFARDFALIADLSDCTVSNVSPYIKDIPAGLNVGANLLSYQFGPKFAWRSNRVVEPFAQVLFGGARAAVSCGNCVADIGAFGNLGKDITITASLNAVAMSAGGGLDIRVSRLIAIRAIQAQYLLTYGAGTIQNSFQINAGVVFRLGGHS